MMPLAVECICCCEVERIQQKIQEGPSQVDCITLHEGFDAVCLNVWVL